jgi:D-alanyl-lipoteichoic acid acyltransferase DltB (MBOAT superfamily)
MAFIPAYILVLGFIIAIDYLSGIQIEKAERNKKKFYLWLSISANIGVLALFKYYNFLNDTLSFLIHGSGTKTILPNFPFLLPIGLSFHTFQAMSYSIEVYRGNQKAEKNLVVYALYVMFFPQLVAGPIERPQNLLPQFSERHSFDYNRVTSGLRLMAWGFFKKLVIADRLGILVDNVYNNAHSFNAASLLLATVFFSFQIFCDFSGYTDIARGAARVIGFKLMKNFNAPYQSASITEFWKNWHISLSSWFRDYLYIPLGGKRVAIPRWYLNIFIVFLISGLWHGANWTFIAWGAIHGLYVIISRIKNNIFEKNGIKLLPDKFQFLSVAFTFSLVSFAWIFFRAENLSVALHIIQTIFSGFQIYFLTYCINSLFSCRWDYQALKSGFVSFL